MECLIHLIGLDVTVIGDGSTSDVWALRHQLNAPFASNS